MIFMDQVAGAGCIFLALCVGALYEISSPQREDWISIPAYMRNGFVALALAFLWRGANLLTIYDDAMRPGHINTEGLIAELVLCYVAFAALWWALSGALRNKWWSRLAWVHAEARRNPDLAPILLHPSEIVDVAHASGQPATGALATGSKVITEVKRAGSAARR